MNVLNIALRKDVFEKLVNGETNEIPIKKNDWWKKRLIDQDTGVYKKFDIASVTCGSAEKFTYAIEKIELRGNKFIITVEPFRWIDNNGDIVEPGDSDSDSDFDDGDSESDGIVEIKGTITREQLQNLKDSGFHVNEIPDQELLKPVKVNSIVINNGFAEVKETFTIKDDGSLETTGEKPHYVLTDEQKRAIVERYVQRIKTELEENETEDVKTRVLNLLDSFCEQKDVFVVNMPNVTIRFNGQIVGYHGGKKLIADRDSDVRMDFKKYELMTSYGIQDDDFLAEVNGLLDSLLKNNYVFINRKSCGFYTTTNDELVFRIFAISKKKYLFK